MKTAELEGVRRRLPYYLLPAIPSSSEVNRFADLRWSFRADGDLTFTHREEDMRFGFPRANAAEPQSYYGDCAVWTGGLRAAAVNGSLIVEGPPGTDGAFCRISGSESLSVSIEPIGPGRAVLRIPLHRIPIPGAWRDDWSRVYVDAPAYSILVTWRGARAELKDGALTLRPTHTGPCRVVFTNAYYQSPAGASAEAGRACELELAPVFAAARAWEDNAPRVDLREAHQPAWRFGWQMHRLCMFEPCGICRHRWVPWGRSFYWSWRTGSFHGVHVVGHWDLYSTVEDLMYYRPDLAQGMLEDALGFFRESDGMMGSPSWTPDPTTCGWQCDWDEKGRSWMSTHPPVWHGTFWEVYQRTRNRDFLHAAYEQFIRNINWWESERRIPGTALFRYGGSYESGNDLSKRFDYDGGHDFKGVLRETANADLSFQMVWYYETMERMAVELGLPGEAERWRRAREESAAECRKAFWSLDHGWFFDYDAARGALREILDISGWWSIISGGVTAEQARAVCEVLKDQFWPRYPAGQGSICESSNYWLSKGLMRYGRKGMAEEVALKVLELMSRVYQKDHAIFEGYQLDEPEHGCGRRYDMPEHPRVESHPFYIGHMPMHSLIYGAVFGVRGDPRGVFLNPSQDASAPGRGSFRHGPASLEIEVQRRPWRRARAGSTDLHEAQDGVLIPWEVARQSERVVFE